MQIISGNKIHVFYLRPRDVIIETLHRFTIFYRISAIKNSLNIVSGNINTIYVILN